LGQYRDDAVISGPGRKQLPAWSIKEIAIAKNICTTLNMRASFNIVPDIAPHVKLA